MPTAVNILPVTPSPAPPTAQQSSNDGDNDGSTSTFDNALTQAQQKDSSSSSKPAAPKPPAAPTSAAKLTGGTKTPKAAAKSQPKVTDEIDTDESEKPVAKQSTSVSTPSQDDAGAEPEPVLQNAKAKPAPARATHSSDETPEAQLSAPQQPGDIVTAVNKDAGESPRQPKDQPDKDAAASVEAIDAQESASGAPDVDTLPALLRAGGAEGEKLKAGVIAATDSSTSTDVTDGATAVAAAIADSDPDPVPATSEKGGSAGRVPADAGSHAAVHTFSDSIASAQGQDSSAVKADPSTAGFAAAKTAPVSPEAQFSQDNQAHIVSSIHAQLLPNGGSMQIRLDPPELGAMNVSVQMRNGVMSATFETSTDQAARLLTHNLGQLKTALEAQGVSVGSLHVQQTPRDSQANSQNSGKESGGNANEQTSQQQQREQQRREMLRRMWRRLSGGKDPLDLVA